MNVSHHIVVSEIDMTHESQTMNGNQSPPEMGRNMNTRETFGFIFPEHTERNESSKKYSSLISRFRHNGPSFAR